jgi:hypothetical protein
VSEHLFRLWPGLAWPGLFSVCHVEFSGSLFVLICACSHVAMYWFIQLYVAMLNMCMYVCVLCIVCEHTQCVVCGVWCRYAGGPAMPLSSTGLCCTEGMGTEGSPIGGSTTRAFLALRMRMK